jgi:AcrR family transcriptional regulator
VLEELFVDGFTRLGEQMVAAPATDDPLADLFRCGAGYRRFAREHPTYYSLMFDRAVPDFQPSAPAIDHAVGTLQRVAERVQRAMDAGAIEPGDALDVAAALWACDHGLASLEARTPAGNAGTFDWDAIADLAIGALLRGLAARS